VSAEARRPRVAHLTVAPEFVERIMIHDLRRLAAREEIVVVCAPGPAVDAVRAEGLRVVTVEARRKLSPLQDLASLWQLWRVLRRERVDLLHSYAPKGGLLGQLAGALAGVGRRVHSCRGLLYQPGMPAWRRRLFRATDRLTNALAHRTVFISAADRDFSVRERLCDEDRARFTGSAVDLRAYSPDALPPGRREEVRRRYGVSDGQRLVLSVGRFVADKGYADIAAAAAELRAEFPDVRYLWAAPELAGEDGVLPATLASGHGVGDLVTRLSHMADVVELYAAADLLVHASYREGVPRVLMEAAAMGVPIVASDIPGCREVIPTEATGRLFAAGDARALAAALRAALRDPQDTAARAAAASVAVRERFDQDALTGRVWAVHEELLRHDPLRP
jgi:glycosyltransferase involved in cell wall biosynthesis